MFYITTKSFHEKCELYSPLNNADVKLPLRLCNGYYCIYAYDVSAPVPIVYFAIVNCTMIDTLKEYEHTPCF